MDLVIQTKEATTNEREATARLIALLAEFDARRLYLGQGCSSLFAYCTNVLYLSEHAAYHRIQAARAVRRFPVILGRLTTGELTLTAVGLLRKFLTADNYVAVLDAARHKSKRDVEHLVAGLAPKPDAAPILRRVASVRALSTAPPESIKTAIRPATPDKVSVARSRDAAGNLFDALDAPTVHHGPDRSLVSADPQSEPVSSDRYLLRLTISGAAHAKLERARDLLRHSVPSGDPSAIIDRALTVLVERLERAKIAATTRPRAQRKSAGTGRHVPAAVKRAVWSRDGGRCTFVGAEGRCHETGHLEFHHLMPYPHGGRTDTDNLTLRCHAHNAYDARLVFGDRATGLSATPP